MRTDIYQESGVRTQKQGLVLINQKHYFSAIDGESDEFAAL